MRHKVPKAWSQRPRSGPRRVPPTRNPRPEEPAAPSPEPLKAEAPAPVEEELPELDEADLEEVPVEEEPVKDKEPKDKEPKDKEPGPPAWSKTWSKRMKKAELLEHAQGQGLEVSSDNTKDEIIAALESVDS